MSKKRSDINLIDYCYFTGFIFIVMGLFLFLYCIVLNISLTRVMFMGNPLFYLPLGILMMLMGLFIKITDKEEYNV